MPVSIKTLKQFALKVHNFAYGTEWDDEDIVSAMAFDEIIEKMMNDEKKLEEQVKKVQEAHCDAEYKAFYLFTENRELKKQIPDKKGKKLSPNDKEVLKRIRDSIHPGPDDVCGKEDYKLLNRLLK
tara:strand:- start:780 stop:1157 length:378 start_codon:yes stop_codon:yes gene_type:complete